jgi:hypothetical protein
MSPGHALDLSDVRQIDQGIVGTKADARFGVLNRSPVVAPPCVDDRAEAERKRRGGAEHQRTVEGVERRFVVPFYDTDNETAHRERHRIIPTHFDRRMRMMACRLPGFGPQASAQVTLLVAPCDEPLDDGIIRLQSDRLFQQGKRLVGVPRHRCGDERERAKIQVIGVEAVGPLAPGTLDLGLAQGRFNGADDTHRVSVATAPHGAAGPEYADLGSWTEPPLSLSRTLKRRALVRVHSRAVADPASS